ncbi:MAG: hypothetical protein V1644_02400, partial [Candidatus Micrarchaeota archaeon]
TLQNVTITEVSDTYTGATSTRIVEKLVANRNSRSIWLTPYFLYNGMMQVKNKAALMIGHGKPISYGAEHINNSRGECVQEKSGFSSLLNQRIDSYVPSNVNVTARPYSTSALAEAQGYYCVVNADSAVIPSVPSIDKNNYVFAIIKKREATIPLDPILGVVVNNLQFKQSSEQPRGLALNVSTANEQLPLFNFDDQPGPAFAFAYSREFAGKFVTDLPAGHFTENGQVFTPQSSPWYYATPFSSGSYRMPLLEYVTAAEALRNATAFRRSSHTQYYCLSDATPSLNPDDCRPTINDWIQNVPSVTTRTEPCTVCQDGFNCDSSCDAGTHMKSNGLPCFNWCASPVCDAPGSQPACNGGIKQVPITGRSTQEWINRTTLVPQRLLAGTTDEFSANAPFKYFADVVNSFNYTIVANLSNCADNTESITDTLANGIVYANSCFVNSTSRRILTGDKEINTIVQNEMFNWMPELPLGIFKISENLGGCEKSSEWERGFYRLTFSYVFDGLRWRWRYYANPLEVSIRYIQKDNSPSSCLSTSLISDDVAIEETRRSQLCYFIYSTFANHTGANLDKPGYCIRSLRDYLPKVALLPTQSGEPKFVNFVTSTDVEAMNDENMPDAIRQTPPPDHIFLRDLKLDLIGIAKCPFNDYGARTSSDSLELKPNFSCLGGNCGEFKMPPVDLNITTFRLTFEGTADWIARVDRDSSDGEEACNDHYSNWDGEDDGAGSVIYNSRTVSGDFKSDMCFVGCYITSCPYVYSFDGKNYNFEHEAFPQAGNLQEEGYSYSPLKFAKAVNG